jgi:hypothetical protein
MAIGGTTRADAAVDLDWVSTKVSRKSPAKTTLIPDGSKALQLMCCQLTTEPRMIDSKRHFFLLFAPRKVRKVISYNR